MPNEQAERPKKQENTSPSVKEEKTALLSASTEVFLKKLMQRSSEWEETSASDVARLRLIASALHRSGNDSTVLGNHDANLLFLQRHTIDFSEEETRALIACGVEGFNHQNVPLWFWLAKSKSGQNIKRLGLTAVIGNEDRRANAIRILLLLNEEPPEIGKHIDRLTTIQAWMDDNVRSDVFKAAIQYLMNLGVPEDIPVLEEYYEKLTSDRKAQIGQAIVAIESKVGEAHALNRVLELGVDELNEDIANQLFSNPASLTTELLTRCLNSEASSIRRRAISILNDRKEAIPEIADSLLSDPDHEVRYHAAEALHIAGRTLDDAVVRKALTIVNNRQGLGLFSRVRKDTHYFDLYRQNRLSEMEFLELKHIVNQSSIFHENEAISLFQNYTVKMREELRSNLKDGFTAYFNDRLEKLKLQFGGEDETVLRTQKLIPFLQRRFLTVSMEALARLNERSDLELFRYAIDTFEVDGSSALVRFFGRFGDWSDIDRVAQLEDYTSRSNDLFSINLPLALPGKAAAMISISRKRVADLLERDVPVLLRRAILQNLQKREVYSLSDEVLLEALNHEDDESRAILALKCCEYLSKARLEGLLERYTELDKQHYYNSVHWLDMGVSLSRKLARSVARQELVTRG